MGGGDLKYNAEASAASENAASGGSIVIFDAEAFGKEAKAARDETKPEQWEEDAHLTKLELWTSTLGVLGLIFGCRGVVSPIGMYLFAMYKYGKFAILAHHSLHGGWGRSRRGWYADGFVRRTIDWLDWIFPMAWIREHNKVHHYRLNEDADPDFVERNLADVAASPMCDARKYMLVGLSMMTWKWFYYASNTLKTLHMGGKSQAAEPPYELVEPPQTITWVLQEAVNGKYKQWYRGLLFDLLFRVIAPPLALHVLLSPVLMGIWRGTKLLGLPFCRATFANFAGADIVSNVHAFVTIVTNHAGGDLWWFNDPCKPDCAEFYLRSVLASADYPAGTDAIDYFHGYLNYQAEHHAFPDLSPLHYRRFHPRFKQLCIKFGIPFVQENILIRTKKTVAVMTGHAKHKCLYGQAVEQPEMWMIRKTEKSA